MKAVALTVELSLPGKEQHKVYIQRNLGSKPAMGLGLGLHLFCSVKQNVDDT